MPAIIAYRGRIARQRPHFLFLPVVLVAGGLALANLFVDSEVLSDVALIAYGVVAITLFAPDLRRPVTKGTRALAWLGVGAGALMILATIGDRVA